MHKRSSTQSFSNSIYILYIIYIYIYIFYFFSFPPLTVILIEILVVLKCLYHGWGFCLFIIFGTL